MIVEGGGYIVIVKDDKVGKNGSLWDIVFLRRTSMVFLISGPSITDALLKLCSLYSLRYLFIE
jgi:hypothetical protein